MAEPQEIATVWEQVLEPDPDDQDSPLLRFHKVKANERAGLPKDPENLLFVPIFLDGNETHFLRVEVWSRLRQCATFIEPHIWELIQRRNPKDYRPLVDDWNTPPKSVNVIAYGMDGKKVDNFRIDIPAQKSDRKAGDPAINYFDDLFVASQETLHDESLDLGGDLIWDKGTTLGSGSKVWRGVNDRLERTDGIVYMQIGNRRDEILRPEGDQNTQYVHLTNIASSSKKQSPASDFLRLKSGRIPEKDYMYVPRPTLDQLRQAYDKDGKEMGYNWGGNFDSVCYRGRMGEIQYIRVRTEPSLRVFRTPEYWQEVYERSIGTVASRGIRSCNPKNLNPLMLVPLDPDKRAVKVLQSFIEETIKQATVGINSTAEAKPRTWVDETGKNTHILLSTSPFGEYETWIAKSDYKAHLRCYAGYKLPADALKLGELEAGFPASSKASLAERAMAEKRSAAPGTATGTKFDTVALSTINAARGQKRDTSQASVMEGVSATTIAKILGWGDEEGNTSENGKVKVKPMTDGPTRIEWPNPGVFVAEWLHRTAFSWGNERGAQANQVRGNLVFGSSEANSLMTRYEKAWQKLFEYEAKIQAATAASSGAGPGQVKGNTFTGTLVSINTQEGSKNPIEEIGLDGDKIYNLKVTKENGKIAATRTVEDGAGKPTQPVVPDYWNATTGTPSLCFSLYYHLANFAPTNLAEMPTPWPVTFFPFQRGFVTRLEADLDMVILSDWKDRRLKEIQDKTAAAGPPKLKATRMLAINSLSAKVVAASSEKAVTVEASHMVSPLTPSQLPHADTWRAATSGQPIHVGGVVLQDTAIVTLDDDGHMFSVPAQAEAKAVVATAPLQTGTGHLPALGSSRAPSKTVALSPDQAMKMGINTTDDNLIPPGFVLSGTVQLFGLFEQQLYVFYGSASDEGLRQIVPITKGTLKISDYIPSLAGTDFEALELQNTQLVYNQYTTLTQGAGTWIETDMVFSGVLQPVSDFLRNICHQENPAIRVSAFLSTENDWTTPIELGSLRIQGTLPNMSVKLGNILEITQLGISVTLLHVRDRQTLDMKWTHSVSFFGQLNIDMPCDMGSMKADFSIVENSGVLCLSATVSEDEASTLGFAGIEGLKLDELTISTSFATQPSPFVLGFNAEAQLSLGESTMMSLDGFYSKQDWGLSCHMNDLDLQGLANFYESLFGSPLDLAPHEVVLHDLFFAAGSSGITISGGVEVEGYASAEASISLNRTGVHITGKVEDIKLGGGFALKEAALNISLSRQDAKVAPGSGVSWKFAITGTVAVASAQVTASMYLDKESGGKLLWTLFGSFEGDFALSMIEPRLQGTFLDLSVHKAALIVSNVDGTAATGALIPPAFTVIKGVQIAASLDSIATFDNAMGNKGAPTTGLTLSAVYDADLSTFGLDVILAVPQTLSMKKGNVWSGPISLAIMAPLSLLDSPSIAIKADFFVRVPRQQAPLKFSGGVVANMSTASLFIELKDQWIEDPFDLGGVVRLGPNLALSVSIDYSGEIYPSGLGIAAGLAIGHVQGQAALSISEQPSDELISMEIDNLGIRDLVDFASLLLQIPLTVPDEFLVFKQLKLYFSSGTTIGTKAYPPGASFNCSAVIFGHDTSVFVGVNKSTKQIEVSGSLQHFDIGPVSISGHTAGTPVQLAVKISPLDQKVLIDGRVSILDFDAELYVDVALLPSPTFHIKSELDFSTHLNFLLEANMRGGISITAGGVAGDLRKLDFDVHAKFSQDILDYIEAQVNMQTLAAKHAADDGIEAAQATLAKAQTDFQAAVDTARTNMLSSMAVYRDKVSKVTSALEDEKKASALREQQLTAALNNALQAFNAAVDRARNTLTTAQVTRTIEIQKAQQKVMDAKAKGDADIASHLKDLNAATDDMNRRFGDAKKKVQDAMNNVNSMQKKVDNASNEYNKAKKSLSRAKLDKLKWVAITGAKWTALRALQASFETAKGVLKGAQSVLDGAGYKAAEGSIQAYQQGVDAARQTADATLNAANATLQQTITTQNALVQTAQNTLDYIQNGGPEKLASDAARSALETFQKAEAAVLSALQAAVDGLAQTTEAIAYKTADAAFRAAVAATHDIDIARQALEVAGQSADAVLQAGKWLVDHTVNILDVESVEVKGDFRAMCARESALEARVKGTFAGREVDLEVEFYPKQGEEFVKRVFGMLIEKVKSGLIKLVD
ncbi:hypothetical protein B0T19DRAFT_482573 [Cercophora scortea]|uniref:Uncharacterized protein n=1 Tax=Cercophora scortea TaxID=314031 RepID=A0AAE0IW60_9PEZI|nr:hypothetical protein B0T19DRAFT_482573 [Cercophora scortea]